MCYSVFWQAYSPGVAAGVGETMGVPTIAETVGGAAGIVWLGEGSEEDGEEGAGGMMVMVAGLAAAVVGPGVGVVTTAGAADRQKKCKHHVNVNIT